MREKGVRGKETQIGVKVEYRNLCGRIETCELVTSETSIESDVFSYLCIR